MDPERLAEIKTFLDSPSAIGVSAQHLTTSYAHNYAWELVAEVERLQGLLHDVVRDWRQERGHGLDPLSDRAREAFGEFS